MMRFLQIQTEELRMEATVPGQNRTGAAVIPREVSLMLEAVQDLSPPVPISTLQIDVERQSYIAEAEAVGSIPPPKSTIKGASKKGGAKAKGLSGSSCVLLDKLGERIAFERTGTRLYDALITKYLALCNAGIDALPPVQAIAKTQRPAAGTAGGETALQTLQRIRAEELSHFRMLCDLVVKLGGDPTAQTPCADVSAAASMGLMQVITDPRTTLAQCLNTILTAELTDNAGWELLCELAEEAGRGELAEPFLQALEAEQQHLATVREWLKNLLTSESGTVAV
jgi:rubrerythrin